MKRTVYVILLCMLLLPACGPRGPSEEEVATQVAEQVAVELTMIASSATSTETHTPIPTDTPTQKPSHTPTRPPASTPTPGTPAPTLTPTATRTPTHTPAPTHTPTPKPTPTSGPSADVVTYLARTNPIIQTANLIVQEDSSVIQVASESNNPYLLCAAEWGDMMSLIDEMETITPPNEAKELHEMFITAFWDWVGLQANTAMFCISYDEDWLKDATLKGTEFQIHMEKAGELLSELTD